MSNAADSADNSQLKQEGRTSRARRVLELLTPRERRRGLLVLAMAVIAAILEAVAVASIFPLLAVLGNPATIESNRALRQLYKLFPFSSTQQFLFALGVAALVLVLVSAVVRLGANYAIYRFTEMRRHSLSSRLLEVYLRQPYEFFLGRNSSDLAKSILSEVDQVATYVFTPVLDMAAKALVAAAMMALIFRVNPEVAAWAVGTTAVVYVVFFVSARNRLDRAGRERLAANRDRFQAASEAFGGIKGIKLLGRENAFLNRFAGASLRMARQQTVRSMTADVPRYAIEAVGVGGVVVLILVMMSTGRDLGELLPTLGLFVFAGFRLLPAAQHIYGGMTRLKFGLPIADVLHQDLHQRARLAELRGERATPLLPQRIVSLRRVSYSYPASSRMALSEIDLELPAASTIGIVGETGSGKTTLVDVILGLLLPSAGALDVDEVPITPDNVRRWQAAVGYVPQDIFLVDATVAENIALGLPAAEIDQAAVERSARLAQLHDFVVNTLPNAYATVVGERGVRLSGGERQRIGIARALYHDPAVLVFDEATNALDNATEAAVVESVKALHGSKTVIMIAHRLGMVAQCDRVHVLKHGRLVASGTYAELIEHAPELRRLSGAAL